jgi:hypothetical protein
MMVPAVVLVGWRLNASWLGAPAKVAVTFCAEERFASVQLAPLQAPEKPLNVDDPSGVAVSVTLLPDSNVLEQVAPQLMPAGLELTLPEPLPASVTLIGKVAMKSAVAVMSPLRSNEQVVPLQALLQPLKREPDAAVAVSWTGVPAGSWAEQVPLVLLPLAVQSMAPLVAGEVMVPLPLPLALTSSV